MGERVDFEERAAMCALNRIFGFEPRVGMALTDLFGSASEVIGAGREELEAALGAYSRGKYLPLITESAFESAAMELERLEADGCTFICHGEPGYPALLTECEDPPLGLYFKGISKPEDVFGGAPAVSVVGTRDLTSYGKEWCGRIVEAMSRSSSRPLVVSGLALGVDSVAHRSALEGGLPTVAVMATGIDSIYPSSNRSLAERISTTPGCALVTDYPPGTDAIRINFLRRNRIIAGIGRATILVESKVRGGGMMTARLAGSYGRDVYALPGRMDDPVSQGCNMLIRENLAEPVGEMGEFMSRLGLGLARIATKEDFKGEVRAFYEGRVDGCLLDDAVSAAREIKARRGISLDELCVKLGWDFGRASQVSAMLECDGFIEIDLLQHCSAVTRRK